MNTVTIFARTSHWWECLMMEYQWDMILFLWINITWCLRTFVCTWALFKLPEWVVYPKSSRENEYLGIKEIPGPCLCLFITEWCTSWYTSTTGNCLEHQMCIVWLETGSSRGLGAFRHNNVSTAVKRKGNFSSAGFSEPLLQGTKINSFLWESMIKWKQASELQRKYLKRDSRHPVPLKAEDKEEWTLEPASLRTFLCLLLPWETGMIHPWPPVSLAGEDLMRRYPGCLLGQNPRCLVLAEVGLHCLMWSANRVSNAYANHIPVFSHLSVSGGFENSKFI